MNLSPAKLDRSNVTKEQPLVSVILATHNPNPQYLKESLISIADQTYENLELVVIDGSNLEFFKQMSNHHHWILHQYQEPAGLPSAWNVGIEAANGKYIAFLADDDWYRPNKIERQVSTLRNGADIVYSDEYVINSDKSKTYISSLPIRNQEEHYIDIFRAGQGIPHLTVMCDQKCFIDDRFDEGLDVREDPHLWVRLFKRYNGTRIPEPLAYKRRREGSVTGDPEKLYNNEIREIQSLCELFPELNEYKKERIQMAKYRYGKHLFRVGQYEKSREKLTELIVNGMYDHRVFFVLALTILPYKRQRIYNIIENVGNKIKSFKLS